jgi:hypothetical protein
MPHQKCRTLPLITALLLGASATAGAAHSRPLNRIPVYQVVLVGRARHPSRVEKLFRKEILPRLAESRVLRSFTAFGGDGGYYAAELTLQSRDIQSPSSVMDVLAASLPPKAAADLARRFKALFFPGSLHILRYRLDLMQPDLGRARGPKEEQR